MTYRAFSAHSIQHPAQITIQEAAHEQIFVANGLNETIQQLTDEWLPAYEAAAPDDENPRLQVRRWLIEAVCEYLAQEGEMELIFMHFQPQKQ